MRPGPRAIALVCTLVVAAFAAPAAHAADALSLFTDAPKIAVGETVTLAAQGQTDAGYGGGHVAFKYQPASADCLAVPGDDNGLDASNGEPAPVDAGPSGISVGGQSLQLGVGTWRICAWLVDDVTGAPVASTSTLVTVLPYMGALETAVKRIRSRLQITIGFSTSAPARLFAALQPARRACPKSPARVGRRSVLILPRKGRLVGSDGGLGRSIRVKRLAAGRWRLCGWLRSPAGSVGPVSRRFSVPRRRRHGGHAAG